MPLENIAVPFLNLLGRILDLITRANSRKALSSVAVAEKERRQEERAEKQRRLKLYDDARKKALDDIASGTKAFDKNLLTLSSGALALSLAFLKDLVPLAHAVSLYTLYTSWVAFTLCVAVTMVSFQFSIKASEKSIPYFEDYYLRGEEESFNKHLDTLWYKAIDVCTIAASALFLVGVVLTLVFVIDNVPKEHKMTEKETAKIVIPADNQKGLKPSSMAPLTEGVKPSMMAPVVSGKVTDGIKPPAMTVVRPAPRPGSAPPPPPPPEKK